MNSEKGSSTTPSESHVVSILQSKGCAELLPPHDCSETDGTEVPCASQGWKDT